MMISNCVRERRYKYRAFWWENLKEETAWNTRTKWNIHDFRLLPQYRWELCSSWLLCSEKW